MATPTDKDTTATNPGTTNAGTQETTKNVSGNKAVDATAGLVQSPAVDNDAKMVERPGDIENYPEPTPAPTDKAAKEAQKIVDAATDNPVAKTNKEARDL